MRATHPLGGHCQSPNSVARANAAKLFTRLGFSRHLSNSTFRMWRCKGLASTALWQEGSALGQAESRTADELLSWFREQGGEVRSTAAWRCSPGPAGASVTCTSSAGQCVRSPPCAPASSLDGRPSCSYEKLRACARRTCGLAARGDRAVWWRRAISPRAKSYWPCRPGSTYSFRDPRRRVLSYCWR